MRSLSPKLLLAFAIVTLVSGGAIGHSYWTRAGGDQSNAPARPVGPQTSANSATDNPDFDSWLERHLQSNSDVGQLRRDLERALANLPSDSESPSNDSITRGIESSGDDSAPAVARFSSPELDSIRRAEATAGADYRSLMDRVDRFLTEHSTGPAADEARALYDQYARAWDAHEFEQAREFSRGEPGEFRARIERYRDYLDRHGAAGRFTAPARAAIEQVEREWAEHDYREIFEFHERYPSDLAATASRVRRFVEDHPAARRRGAAEQFLARYEKAAAPGEYRVRVKSGQFARTIGKTFSLGPDLAVEIEVAGVRLGRTPIIANSYEPTWNHEFPQRVRWRIGDSVKIRVIDFDYRNSTVLLIEPPKEELLAMRYLSEPIEANGHRLEFDSDFEVPPLPRP